MSEFDGKDFRLKVWLLLKSGFESFLFIIRFDSVRLTLMMMLLGCKAGKWDAITSENMTTLILIDFIEMIGVRFLFPRDTTMRGNLNKLYCRRHYSCSDTFIYNFFSKIHCETESKTMLIIAHWSIECWNSMKMFQFSSSPSCNSSKPAYFISDYYLLHEVSLFVFLLQIIV